MNNYESTIESFIEFCDDMKIAEEGFTGSPLEKIRGILKKIWEIIRNIFTGIKNAINTFKKNHPSKKDIIKMKEEEIERLEKEIGEIQMKHGKKDQKNFMEIVNLNAANANYRNKIANNQKQLAENNETIVKLKNELEEKKKELAVYEKLYKTLISKLNDEIWRATYKTSDTISYINHYYISKLSKDSSEILSIYKSSDKSKIEKFYHTSGLDSDSQSDLTKSVLEGVESFSFKAAYPDCIDDAISKVRGLLIVIKSHCEENHITIKKSEIVNDFNIDRFNKMLSLEKKFKEMNDDIEKYISAAEKIKNTSPEETKLFTEIIGMSPYTYMTKVAAAATSNLGIIQREFNKYVSFMKEFME